MSALIFDTHAHYDDSRFDDCRHETLMRNFEGGVEGIINCSVDFCSAGTCQSMADRYGFCYAAVGVHPENIPCEAVDISPLYTLAKHPKTVAVGEIGLDYHYEDGWDKEVQKKWFSAQLEAALDLDMPVIVHNRDSHADVLELLKKYRPKGVVHCFSGSAEMAKEVVALGMYIGLGGVVTFNNARRPIEVAESIPLSRLLLETDAPYMAPVPFRGKTCESLHIRYTAQKIAEIRGMGTDELLNICRENARRLFGV